MGSRVLPALRSLKDDALTRKDAAHAGPVHVWVSDLPHWLVYYEQGAPSN